MSKIKTCQFCGKTYEYCGHCKEYSSSPDWMATFDSQKCYELYEAVAAYNIGVGTIENVKATLDKYDVVDYSIFSKKLQDKLHGLTPVENKEVNENKVEEKEVIKEQPKKTESYVPNKFKKSNKKYDNGRRVNNEE